MDSLLTLDPTTLFYWTRIQSKNKRKHSDSIQEWAAEIPSNVKPASNQPTTKKARREELPDGVSEKWFRYRFVSTYLAFVGQTLDPWNVPVHRAVEVMQKIWDAIGPIGYDITPSTLVYQKTVKHCQEFWRKVGNFAVRILLAILSVNSLNENSNETRQESAREYLEDFRFLYDDTSHEDKEHWKGLFRGIMVSRIFTEHFNAIKGAQKIPGLHSPDEESHGAIGAVGLAAASVERALKLVATGTLTIAMTQVPKGQPILIPRTFNRTNGKKSTRSTSFSDIAWQKASRAYAKSARALSKDKFDVIVEDALRFVKPTRVPNRVTDTKETTNERTFPVDDPDSGEK